MILPDETVWTQTHTQGINRYLIERFAKTFTMSILVSSDIDTELRLILAYSQVFETP